MYCKVKAEAPFPNILFSLSPVTLNHNYASSLELLKSFWILRTVRHKYRSGQKSGFGPLIIKSLKKGSEHQNDKQHELFYRNITATATRWFDITALLTSFLTYPWGRQHRWLYPSEQGRSPGQVTCPRSSVNNKGSNASPLAKHNMRHNSSNQRPLCYKPPLKRPSYLRI